MSNGKTIETNPWERLFKLWAMICKLLLDGKRDITRVADALQTILDETVITLAERIAACKLNWFNDNILKWRREDQPSEPRGEVELLDLGRRISTEDALAEIERRGYDPATIEELCDFGTKNPEAQRKNPIVALGSVFVDPSRPSRSSPFRGTRCSPYLLEVGAGRGLDLFSRDRDWLGDCLFLVIRRGARKSDSAPAR